MWMANRNSGPLNNLIICRYFWSWMNLVNRTEQIEVIFIPDDFHSTYSITCPPTVAVYNRFGFIPIYLVFLHSFVLGCPLLATLFAMNESAIFAVLFSHMRELMSTVWACFFYLLLLPSKFNCLLLKKKQHFWLSSFRSHSKMHVSVQTLWNWECICSNGSVSIAIICLFEMARYFCAN